MKRQITMLLMTLAVITLTAQTATQGTNADMLKSNIEQDTTDWQSMLELGQYYREHSNTNKALYWTQRANNIHPCTSTKRELSRCYFARGYYQKCIDISRELLQPTEENTQPDSTELFIMSRCFVKLSIPDSAILYQTMVAERDIENQVNLIALSKTLLSMSAAKSAVNILERYYAIDSTNLAVNEMLAQSYYQAGYPRKAIKHYEKLIADGDSCNALNYYYLGMAYNQKGMPDEAVACLKKANDMTNLTNGLIRARLGITQLLLPWEEENGIDNIHAAIELLQPDDATMHTIYYNLGCYYTTRDPSKGIANLQKAIKHKDDDSETYYHLAYCYYMSGNEDKEYENWQKYLEFSTEKTDKFVAIGVSDRIKKLKEKRFMEGKEKRPE